MVVYTALRLSCGRINNTSGKGDWSFNDPFKARYPNKPDSYNVPHCRKLQQLYKEYNNYDKSTHQTRFQFTLQNKMIWVSSASLVPKSYGMKTKSKQGLVYVLYLAIFVVLFIYRAVFYSR